MGTRTQCSLWAGSKAYIFTAEGKEGRVRIMDYRTVINGVQPLFAAGGPHSQFTLIFHRRKCIFLMNVIDWQNAPFI
jgi:hypothetical protein